MIKILLTCAALLAVAVAERISNTPDVTWNRSPSSGSSNSNSDDRFPITGGSRSGSSNSGSQTGSRAAAGSSFGFDRDSSSQTDNGDSRFPLTGGSSGSGSRGSSFGSGSGSRMSGSGSDSSFNSATTVDPTRNYYVRIIASLVKLDNAKSALSTGSSCSTFGKCDPIIYADLDTDRPNAAWPGARDIKYWPQVYSAKSMDSISNIGVDNITKDSCGQNYREADLRVRVEDKKSIGSNAVINEFDCPINRLPQDSLQSATWSPVLDCIPRFPAGKQTLSMRYKVFYVSRFTCGLQAGSTTTKSKGLFGALG